MINTRKFGFGDKCYCTDASLIENYEIAIKDEKQCWDCHHKLEAFYTVSELIQMGRYYNVSPRELIFLTHKDHSNWPHVGRIVTEETKSNMSKSHVGKTSGMKGKRAWNKDKKTGPLSKTHKQKCSEAQLGRHWFTNGTTSVKTYECPPGFRPGRK